MIGDVGVAVLATTSVLLFVFGLNLLYLRVTEQYRLAVDDPNFFDDNAFVNHEDAVFAKYYFTPMDAYNQGNLAAVPQAWQIALNAATVA